MQPVDVLMPRSMDSFVYEEIDRRFRLHKLWMERDEKAYLDKVKNDIEFIVSVPGGQLIDGAYMSQFPKLKGVSNFGVGYDMVDAKWAAENGIMVSHTPDVLNAEVADMSIGLTLAVIRQIPQADKFVRDGRWLTDNFPLSASMIGRTMGILGLGRIGKEIAKRAEAFGVKVVYHGRHKQEGVTYPYYDKFIDMARDSDILMLIAPGSAETHHIVNKEVLEALGPNGILINMGRGTLVDENALIEALEQKKIHSAGLDVYAVERHVPERLIALPNVVLLPHVGSSSFTTRHAIGQLVIDNLQEMIDGKPPVAPVPEMIDFKPKILG